MPRNTIKSILMMLVISTIAFAAEYPDELTAYQAYVHNHTTTLLMDALTNFSIEGDEVPGAVKPICRAHIGTFPISISRGKGYLHTAGITYSGWVVQLRVTFVFTSNISSVPGLSLAIQNDHAYKVGRFWKVNGEYRAYADEGELTFFFQKYVMVYYLQSVDGPEFWDADFLTGGAIGK